MTLLDILPSLRGTTTPRLDPALWPASTHSPRGRITVGGVALEDIADKFRTPTLVIDDEHVHDRRSTAEILYSDASPNFCAVAGWARKHGATVAAATYPQLCAALDAGVDPSRIVFTAPGSDAALYRAAFLQNAGRIVVGRDAPFSATPDGRVHKVVARLDLCTDNASLAHRILSQPALQLAGVRVDVVRTAGPAPTLADTVREAVYVMAEWYRAHGILISELHVGITDAAVPDDLSFSTTDHSTEARDDLYEIDCAVEDACIRARFARPRVTVESGKSMLDGNAVVVCRVQSVDRVHAGTSVTSTVVVDRVASSVCATNRRVRILGIAVANRHPVGGTATFEIVGNGAQRFQISAGIELPSDIRAGDVLAIASRTSSFHCSSSVAVAHGTITELSEHSSPTSSTPRPEDAARNLASRSRRR